MSANERFTMKLKVKSRKKKGVWYDDCIYHIEKDGKPFITLDKDVLPIEAFKLLDILNIHGCINE